MMVALMVLGGEPIKVTVGVFKHVGYPEAVGDAYVGHLAAELGARGLRVTTQGDVQQLLGVERQKMLLGCDEESTDCALELANALDADVIVTGSMTKTAEGYLVSLRFLSPKKSGTLSTTTGHVDTERRLLEWLADQARLLAPRLVAAIEELRSPGGGPSPVVGWLPVVVGSVLLAGGGTSYGLSYLDRKLIAESASPRSEVDAIHRGQLLQDAGVGFMIAGGAAVVAGLIWRLVAPESHPLVRLVLSGSTLGFAWTFP